MNYLNKFDILLVAERAKEASKKGYIVNGSIGALLDENGKLVTYNDVNDYMKSNFENFLSYTTQLGPKEYREGYLKWIFNDNLTILKTNHNVSISATSGGTEAIFLTFKLFSKTHTALLPDIKWPNYNNLIEMSEIKHKEFKRFDDSNKFNFIDLKEKIENTNGKILLVLNDPCHNPTGYSFSLKEYDELFSLINSYKDKVTLLLDLAYLDYSLSKDKIIKKISESNLSTPLFLAFSCSKSFAIYGLRMGAIITIFNKNDEDIYSESFKKIIRGTISSSNHLASGGLSLFFKDEFKMNSLKNKIKEETNRLFKKGKAVEKILLSKGYQVFPYSSGFYVSFICEDSKKLLDMLENKNIFFTYVNDNTIRIAICSLKDKDIAYLEENL